MQLKAIGEVINSFKSSGASGNVVDILKGVGDLTKAAQILKSIDLPIDKFRLLKQAFEGASDDAIQAALGITAVGTASIASTGAVNGLGAALKAAFLTSPLTVITAVISAAAMIGSVIGAVVGTINDIEQAQIDAAKEAGTAFADSSGSIESQVDKIYELRDALNSGTLTEQEAYQAKSDLFSIQQSLTDTYGEQAANIDLVNGSLEQQIALVNQLSQSDAEKFLNENIKGIEKAEEEMTKNISNIANGDYWSLGQYYKNDTNISNGLEDILSKYDDFIDTTSLSADGLTVGINFTANAEDAEVQLNNFITDLRALEDQYGQSEIIDNLIASASEGLSEANTILSDWQDLYEQSQKAELIADTRRFGLPGEEAKTASVYMYDLTNAIEDYNEALSIGDTDDISKAASNYEKVSKTIFDLLRTTPMAEYIDDFVDANNQLNEAAVAANNFKEALSDADNQPVQELIKSLKEANLSDVDFKNAILTEGFQPGENNVWKMLGIAQDFGIVENAAKVTSSELDNVVNYLTAAGILVSNLSDETGELASRKTFASLFSDTGEGSLNDIVDTFQSDIAALGDLKNQLESEKTLDFTDIGQEIPELAGQTEDLENAINNIKFDKLSALGAQWKSVITDIQDENERILANNYFQELVDSVDLSGIDNTRLKEQLLSVFTIDPNDSESVKTAEEKLEKFYDWWPEFVDTDLEREIVFRLSLNPEASDWSPGDWNKYIYEMTKSIGEDYTLPNLVQDEDFTSKVSEYTDSISSLLDAQEQLSNGDFSDADLVSLINQFPELASQTDNLDQAISNLISTTDTDIGSFFDNIINTLNAAGLTEQAAQVQNYANAVTAAAHEIEASTATIGSMTFETPGLDAYNKALESENEGSLYESLKSAYEKAKELYDEGLVGTDDFKEGAKLFSANGMDDVGNFEENMAKIERYMTDDSTGVQNFLDDLESKGYATMEKMADGTEKWSYNMTDLEAAAKDMGMSFDWFMSMFGRLGDYGFANDFFTNIEDGQAHLNDLYSSLDAEQQKLEDLEQAQADGDATVTDTVINEQQAKIDSIRESILATQDLIDQLAARTTQDYEKQAQSAADTARSLVAQLTETSNGSVREMIESDIQDLAKEYHLQIVYDSEGNIVDVVTKDTETAQETANENPIQVPMSVTTETEQQNTPSIASVYEEATHIILPVDTTLGQDNATPEIESQKPVVGVTAELETNNVETQEVAVDYTKGNQEEATTSTADVDYEKGKQEEADPSTTRVNYEKGFQELPTPQITRVNYELGYQALPQPKTVRVNYDTSGAPAGATAMGTAHADGTVMGMWKDYRHSIGAYAGGTSQDWALPRDENALANEVGTESIVRDGVWRLIPGGAHIESFKKGDIIFNAAQTAELIKYGKVISGGGHGIVAHADGTAYNVINAYAAGSGGGSFRGGASSSTSSGSSGSSVSNAVSSASKTASKATSKAKKENKEVAESIDWIVRAIEAVERQIDRMDLRASSTYRSFSTRNSSLSKEIGHITDEIELQEKAYKRYQKEANSVGLSKKYKDRVKNGTIDIESISNENTREKIEEFQKWWDKRNESYDAMDQLKEDLSAAYEEAFDLVATQYDGILSQFEHQKNLLEGYVEQAEQLGYMASTGYYDALIKNENQNLSNLKKEQQALINQLNTGVNSGAIKTGTEAWNEMQSQINEVTEAIQESETALIEFNNEIRQIQWDRFDYMQESVSRLTEEAEFFADLMSNDQLFDDKGFANDNAWATLGMYGQNYNTYMEQALSYAREIQSIEKEMAKDPYDTELIKRRDELLDQQREMILAAEDEKNSIKDLVEEGINAQLEALQELIDKYKEAINSQKDLYDFQKNIADQTKEVAKLQKQLSAYAGDTSEEGRSRLQQTQTELEEAQANLEETQYDQWISDQEALLDNLYSEYENILNQRLDNLDQLVTDVITAINEKSDIISATLQTEAANVGYTISDNMTQLWSSTESAGATGIKDVLTTYIGNFTAYAGNFQAFAQTQGAATTAMQLVLGNVYTELSKLVSGSDKEAKENVKKATSTSNQAKGSTTTTSSANKNTSTNKNTSNKNTTSKKSSSGGDGKAKVGDRVTFVSGRYYEDSYGQGNSGYQYRGKKVYITKINKSGSHPYHISTGKKLGSGDLGWLKLSQLKGYKTGVRSVIGDQIAWTNEAGPEAIIRPSDGSMLVRLQNRDQVLNADATDNLYRLTNNPTSFITDALKNTVLPDISNIVGGTVENSINMNFNLPNVKNYDEFISTMQKDHRFEKMIQDMTVGQIANRGTFAKMKYNFKR